MESPTGYFPFGFLLGFLRLLRDTPHVRVLTYADMPWGDDFDSKHGFPDELQAWKRERDPNLIYVLLQHDVDSNPALSWHAVKAELDMGVPSNVMLFNRRVDRARFKSTGDVTLTEYDVDDYLLRLAQQRGFVIGYHQNAYEQSGYDLETAQRVFEEDVAALRKRGFKAEFFSPHGGVYGPGRINNHSLPVPPSLARSVRWVANTRTPRLRGSFSDGGISGKRLDPEGRDLRRFVQGWQRGERYRVLLHPQYYHTPCYVSENLSGTSWYGSLLRACESGKTGWEDVAL